MTDSNKLTWIVFNIILIIYAILLVLYSKFFKRRELGNTSVKGLIYFVKYRVMLKIAT